MPPVSMRSLPQPRDNRAYNSPSHSPKATPINSPKTPLKKKLQSGLVTRLLPRPSHTPDRARQPHPKSVLEAPESYVKKLNRPPFRCARVTSSLAIELSCSLDLFYFIFLLLHFLPKLVFFFLSLDSLTLDRYCFGCCRYSYTG